MRGSPRAPALLALLLVTPAAVGQTIQAPYKASYTLADLGSVPGLPMPYGGLAFLPSNSNVIVIGGAANTDGGALYSIGVVRDATNHITGFTGSAALFSEGQYNDGGVVFGPGGVLFYTRYPVNEIGQIEPGSTVNDRVIGLKALGITSSVGALNFVPGGFPGAGQLKIVSYSTGDWYTASFSPDGTGTFNITAPVLNTNINVGPEGFVYVPIGSPVFPSGTSMLVSEYDNNVVATYQIDSSGNPLPATRAVFVSGLEGAEGAVIDPVTGDFLFSTFGAKQRVIAVRGFGIGVPGAWFYTLTPCRIADTRLPNGPQGGPALVAGASRNFGVGGICGVSPTAKSVAVNVTVVNAAAIGSLTLYPAGTSPPLASTLNYRASTARASNAVVLLGTSGSISVLCSMAKGTADFILDVTGYFE